MRLFINKYIEVFRIFLILYSRWAIKVILELMILQMIEVTLLDYMYMEVLFLIFWKACVLFSIVSIPIYIPTNSAQMFSSLHILISTCYLLSL